MKAIVHTDLQWGIGRENKLMFHIPADMQFFRKTTTGNVVVMGENTLRSFPKGMPLKDRTNIVLSPAMQRDDCIIVRSIPELLEKLCAYDPESVYVIGGASVYRQLLPYCSEVLVTKVEAIGGADTFFPNLDEDADFALTHTGEPILTNGYTIRFLTYSRIPR